MRDASNKFDRGHLTRREDLEFGGAPKVAHVVFKPVPSEAARAAALTSGQIDIAQLPPAMVDRLASQKGVSVTRIGSFRAIYLGVDTNNPLLSDPRIRHAIDSAICYIGFLFPLWDAKRQTIADKLMKTVCVPL